MAWISADIQNRILTARICDNTLVFKRKEIEMYNNLFDGFDYDSGQLDGYGYDPESGGYCYDGFTCPDASSMEEAEMEYWYTH